MQSMKFPAVYLVHGTGGSPEGSVRLLQAELEKFGAQHSYVRPRMPHSDPHVAPSVSVSYLRDLGIPEGALLIGISLGGLVAAMLQETGRPDLHVIAINAPTHVGDTELHSWMQHRISLYCASDQVIAGRTADWPLLAAEAHDLPWLIGHNTDPHKEALAYIISCYVETGFLNWENR
jgi:pimeloyl-ACP methyl ester carboxylesterase